MIARSANDNTDNWPFWYVAESYKSLNILGRVARELGFDLRDGAVFVSKEGAEMIANMWNAKLSITTQML